MAFATQKGKRMVKLYDHSGSFEFEPGDGKPPTYTHGDQPTEESIAGRMEDMTIEKAKEILGGDTPQS